ncbi:AhpD family alkylhydroperoxidase [Paraburkholderia sp. MM5496-R1]|uniref:carboxymuconolactone decarboxylase family protein n=1 Tax=unclassified Paraburkholderia TaxID=2615204 RepID=UPI003D1B4E74
MSYFPQLDAARLSDTQRRLSAAVAKPGAPWPGPFNALARAAEVGLCMYDMLLYYKSASRLSLAAREVVVLTVARALNCPYGWHAHVPLALSAGVNARALEKLAVAVHASYGDDTIDAVARITRGVLDNRPVERTDVLDDALLVEVITFVGIYRMLFQLVNTDGPDYVPSCIAFETDGSGSLQHSSRN